MIPQNSSYSFNDPLWLRKIAPFSPRKTQLIAKALFRPKFSPIALPVIHLGRRTNGVGAIPAKFFRRTPTVKFCEVVAHGLPSITTTTTEVDPFQDDITITLGFPPTDGLWNTDSLGCAHLLEGQGFCGEHCRLIRAIELHKIPLARACQTVALINTAAPHGTLLFEGKRLASGAMCSAMAPREVRIAIPQFVGGVYLQLRRSPFVTESPILPVGQGKGGPPGGPCDESAQCSGYVRPRQSPPRIE